jgi:transcriptional regulator with XRE-family HTH domain
VYRILVDFYGTAIRRLRKKKRWTQTHLAARAHVNIETLIRAEQSGNVGILLLARIAHALGEDVSAFFGTAAADPKAEKPPAFWGRLKGELRAEVERYARRLLGESLSTGAAKKAG